MAISHMALCIHPHNWNYKRACSGGQISQRKCHLSQLLFIRHHWRRTHTHTCILTYVRTSRATFSSARCLMYSHPRCANMIHKARWRGTLAPPRVCMWLIPTLPLIGREASQQIKYVKEHRRRFSALLFYTELSCDGSPIWKKSLFSDDYETASEPLKVHLFCSGTLMRPMIHTPLLAFRHSIRSPALMFYSSNEIPTERNVHGCYFSSIQYIKQQAEMYWPYAGTSGLIMSPRLLFVCLRTAAEHHPSSPLPAPTQRNGDPGRWLDVQP